MGITTGIGVARHRKCVNCPDQHLMTWPRFRHSVCSALGRDDEQLREQDAEFYDDPISECPMGFWHGIKHVDMEAERAANNAKAIERETAAMKKLVDILSPDEKMAVEISGKIGQLVEAKIIKNPETAAALEAYVEARTIAGKG